MFHYPVNDRLLSFYAEWVHRVDGITAGFLGIFERSGKGIVKVAPNLYYLSAELERLAKLAWRNLTFWNVDVTLYVFISSIHRCRSGGIAS